MCVVRILYEDIIKFLLLSQKKFNERAPSLCFGLVWALENYFLLDSAEFLCDEFLLWNNHFWKQLCK